MNWQRRDDPMHTTVVDTTAQSEETSLLLTSEPSEMLTYNVGNWRHFASDTETGEIFGISTTPEVEGIKAVYIANKVEYGFTMRLEGDRAHPRLKILCAGVRFGLQWLFVGDHAKDTALVRRIITAIIEINRTRPLIERAIFCSDFEEFKARIEATGKRVPFDMPSDEELRQMSLS
jgi:hypothetical protein